MTVSIQPEDISGRMLRRIPYSLNAISHDAAAAMVQSVLDDGVNVQSVFVDTVGDPGAYQNKLNRMFNHTINFTVSKKADSLYPCVSAASICAKETRDESMVTWHLREPGLAALAAAATPAASASAAPVSTPAASPGANYVVEDVENSDDEMWGATARAATPAAASTTTASSAAGVGLHPSTAGSGYPGDPATKEWMKRNLDPVFGWPSVVRFSWAPAKDALESSGTPVEWPPEPGEPVPVDESQMKLASFFAPAAAKGKTVRAPYFRSARMAIVTDNDI